MVLGVVNWLWVDNKPALAERVVDPSAPVNWEAILYHGDRRLARDAHHDRDRRRRAAGRRS